MQCHFCNRPSEIRFTEIVGGQKQSMPVCRACAAQRGLVPDEGPAPSTPPTPLTKITLKTPWSSPRVTGHCPRCRTTLVAIRRKGRVGCPQCYRHFRRQLRPLLERVHGGLEHHGHRPGGETSSLAAVKPSRPAPREASRQQRILGLESELRRAIESEDFESAARIRDRLAAARSAQRSEEEES